MWVVASFEIEEGKRVGNSQPVYLLVTLQDTHLVFIFLVRICVSEVAFSVCEVGLIAAPRGRPFASGGTGAALARAEITRHSRSSS